MHAYSIDTRERPRITGFLALLSIALALVLQKCLGFIHLDYWWVPAPSAMTAFWGLYSLFAKHLWTLKILRTLGLVRATDISGTWKGKISGTRDQRSFEVDGNLRVIQTWTTIEFALETKGSSSKSYCAHAYVAHPQDLRVYYQYLSEPKIGAPETMNIHHGTAFLELSADGRELRGEYYSGRGRGTQGTMKFRRH